MRLSSYQIRCIDQGRAWVNGASKHNIIDDECCADFSCCEPQLFELDRCKRIERFNKLLSAYGQPKEFIN